MQPMQSTSAPVPWGTRMSCMSDGWGSKGLTLAMGGPCRWETPCPTAVEVRPSLQAWRRPLPHPGRGLPCRWNHLAGIRPSCLPGISCLCSAAPGGRPSRPQNEDPWLQQPCPSHFQSKDIGQLLMPTGKGREVSHSGSVRESQLSHLKYYNNEYKWEPWTWSANWNKQGQKRWIQHLVYWHLKPSPWLNEA